MKIAELRGDLEEARAHVREGRTDKAIDTIERALRTLDEDRLLTTTEAARALGIRSVNTLKLLVRAERVHTVSRGNRTLIPLSEIERIQQGERVRGIRASDRLHDATAELGGDRALSAEELADLEASRPGRLPWEDGAAPGRRTGEDAE